MLIIKTTINSLCFLKKVLKNSDNGTMSAESAIIYDINKPPFDNKKWLHSKATCHVLPQKPLASALLDELK